ncbi:tetraspanin-32 [Rhynchocyon petersi]
MGTRSPARVAKCQMLVTGLLVLLLSLSVATMVALTHSGAHFTVFSSVSLERNPYETVHHWAFSVGVSVAGLLTLGAMLCTAATMKEAEGLMAGGFLCFSLVFCVLVQTAFWRFHNPSQVEDAMLDTYDLVYEWVVRNLSSARHQELTTIHDLFQCCGKRSPSGEADIGLCPGELAGREDCLQGIQSFLKTHLNIAAALVGLGLILSVYAMVLSSFLWAAIRSGRGMDHHGSYTLTARYSCPADEPNPAGDHHLPVSTPSHCGHPFLTPAT